MQSGQFITTALLSIAGFNNLFALFMLFFRKETKSPANRMLGLYLAGMGLVMVTLFLIMTRLILEVPWLFRLPSPVYYTMFPAAYLYARMTVYDNSNMRRRDWLHFLPALLHLVEMMPYYLKTPEFKLAHVRESLANPIGAFLHDEGWLSDYWHNILRGIQGLVYGMLILRLVINIRRIRPKDYFLYTSQVRWLAFFAISILLFSGHVASTLLFRDFLGSPLYVKQLLGLICLSQILPAFTIISSQSILYGMPRTSPATIPGSVTKHTKEQTSTTIEPPSSSPAPTEQSIDVRPSADIPEQYNEYFIQLEELMEQEKPFLQPRYSGADLARDLQIPQHHVTYLLNHALNTRFNDYINKKRIAYIKTLMAQEQTANFTLEALAHEAGFNSRITFIRAVQKHTGMNPSAYFYNTDSEIQQ